MTDSALGSIRRQTLDVMRRHTSPGDRIAVLDFPIHHNAGDSLIFAGQDQYFDTLDVHVDYRSDLLTHDDALLRERVGDRTIFWGGGGNFGDRWPVHQEFRERIAARFPDNKIVGLPQSIDYANSDAVAKTAEIYARHPNLTLLLREQRSYDFALANFPANKIEFCPDMAFGANISAIAGGEAVDVVKLLRMDSEQLDHGTVDIDYSTAQYDWGLRGKDLAVWNAITLPTRVAYNFPRAIRPLYPAIARSYPCAISLNLGAAQRILSQGSVVLTDRLHAAVLAGMMGKRVVAMDNANKKVSGTYDAYLHRFDNVRFASTAAEAAEMVADAVAASR
ncbi:MAG: polysaccharide pyruvyl transferase family protein [Rhodococcus sp. (in: high G+C Gram-positive bacteria)]